MLVRNVVRALSSPVQEVVSKIFRTLDQATAPVCMTCDWWRGRMFM